MEGGRGKEGRGVNGRRKKKEKGEAGRDMGEGERKGEEREGGRERERHVNTQKS